MANTTNFNWATPDDTDLVKDGAAAIRTLGSSIDTSFVDLKGGTTGQVLSKASNTDLDYTWVTTDDANAIQNAIVDAKGDLIAASANDTPARLAVGNNGETLVADSSATTGLRWQGDWNTGKNKLINADFYINQRAFTSTTTNTTYGFDRWFLGTSDGTSTYSAQTFTAGTAPVAGYEGVNFARLVSTGQTATNAQTTLRQYIEDVRTLAGQTVTVSFWAKAGSGTPSVAAEFQQSFGGGGSSTVFTLAGKTAITTSWARYSLTVAIPSISGKTIGTSSSLNLVIFTSAGSDFNARTNSLGIQSATIEFWGIQVEAGSVATPFTTATGTLAGELAACQRYYYRTGAGDIYSGYGNGVGKSTTAAYILINFPQTMRAIPSSTIDGTGTIGNYALYDGVNVTALTALAADRPQVDNYSVTATVASGLTQYRPYTLINNNTSTAFLGFSAEL